MDIEDIGCEIVDEIQLLEHRSCSVVSYYEHIYNEVYMALWIYLPRKQLFAFQAGICFVEVLVRWLCYQ